MVKLEQKLSLRASNNAMKYALMVVMAMSALMASSSVLEMPITRVEKNTLKQLKEVTLQEASSGNNQQTLIEENLLGLTPPHSGLMNLISSSSVNTQSPRYFLSGIPKPFSLITASTDSSKYFEKTLLNYFNVQYYGSLFIGSQLKEMTFIFDTGSSWFWAPTVECVSCHFSEKYDTTLSSYYQQLSNNLSSIRYGTGAVSGYYSSDQVCLISSNSSCIPNFKLLSVVETVDLTGLKADGILGLAPSAQRTQASLFIDELYNNGIIDQRVFSFYISQGVESSVATFGGYNLQYADPNKNLSITWNELTNTNYWTVGLVSVKVGDRQLPISTYSAIVDTGTSYLLMPETDFLYFSQFFSYNSICGTDTVYNLYTCLCDSSIYNSYPDIKIQIGNNVYSLPKESYVVKYGDKCYFQIMTMDFPAGTGFWILGDNFLSNYYTIYDLENNRVGFVGAVAYEDIPSTILDYLAVFLAVALIIFLIIILYRVCCSSSGADSKTQSTTADGYRALAGDGTVPNSQLQRQSSERGIIQQQFQQSDRSLNAQAGLINRTEISNNNRRNDPL